MRLVQAGFLPTSRRPPEAIVRAFDLAVLTRNDMRLRRVSNLVLTKGLRSLCTTPEQKNQQQNRDRNPEEPKQNISGGRCLFDFIV